MNQSLYAIAIVLLFILACAKPAKANNEVELYENFTYRYDCDNTSDMTAIVFFLHGAGICDGECDPITEPLIPDTLRSLTTENCLLLIMPFGNGYTINGHNYTGWDFTNYMGYGHDLYELIKFIALSKTLFNKPIYLIGGSAGAVMAYGIAAELYATDRQTLINGLVMMDGLSPFSLSITERAPGRYKNMRATLDYSVIDINYYRIDPEYSYVQLGLPSAMSQFTIPTIIGYSINDPIVPEYIKEDFAHKLSAQSSDTTVFVAGSGHNIGLHGWQQIESWLLDRLYR